MKAIVHHPDGVIVGNKLFLRDEYYAADRVTLREWLALVTLITGLLVWVALLIGGAVWLIAEVLHRWR